MDIDIILKSSLKELEINFNQNQIRLLKDYIEMVYERNKTINIIGTKEKEDIVIRHFLDSISILKYSGDIFCSNSLYNKILDVGTGAGLPGMALSIFLEKKKIYLLDKNEKKVKILNFFAKKLKLKNVVIIKGRAEELARENLYRGKFDIVLARAVAKFSALCELIIPFCRINGKIIFYKSLKVFNDLEEGRRAIGALGGRVEKLQKVRVPYLNEFRSFLIINKDKNTPDEYPRKFKKIKSKPIR